jgi:hypothetical protein
MATTSTQHVTPTEHVVSRVDSYDAQRRRDARRAGTLLARTALPIAFGLEQRSILLFAVDKTLTLRVRVDDGPWTVASLADVTAALTKPMTAAVAADKQAAKAVTALIPKDSFDLSRQMTVNQNVPFSARFGVLTDLLSRRFWLAENLAATSLPVWAGAAGVTLDSSGMPTHDAVKRWLTVFADDAGLSAAGFDRDMHKAMRTCTVALDRCLHPTSESGWVDRNHAFDLSEALNGLASVYEMIDPLLRDRVKLTGAVSAAYSTRRDGNKTVRLVQPIGVKAGKDVIVLADDGTGRVGRAVLRNYTVADDVLYAVLNYRRGDTGFDIIDSAAATNSSFLIASSEAPFMAAPAATFTRWGGKTVSDKHPAPRTREVPAYVALAGWQVPTS